MSLTTTKFLGAAILCVGALTGTVTMAIGDQGVDPSAGECSGYRWAVATASDRAASRIERRSRSSSPGRLALVRVPQELSDKSPRQRKERQQFSVEADLVSWRLEQNGSISVVVVNRFSTDPDKQMRVVLPDPQCKSVTNSPLKDQMRTARKGIIRSCEAKNLPKDGTSRQLSGQIKLTGVAFYGVKHLEGSASNGLELHPVTAVDTLCGKVEAV